MKIQAVQEIRNNVTVDIDPKAVIEKLRNTYLGSRVKEGKKGDYINSGGFWEDWTDTGHGSGLTKVYDQATHEEVQIMNAFELVEKFAKTY